MARLVASLGIAHAPGVTGWIDRAPQHEQDAVLAGYAAFERRVRQLKPDVVIGVGNDHLLNFPMSCVPDFCVGIGDAWQGPAPWFRSWLNVPDYRIGGHRELGRALVRESARAGINHAFAEELLFDDNWSVPLKFLFPDYDVRFVPIHMNCVVPPVPSASHCLRVGAQIARIVAAFPSDERVLLMATGGLSHDPGGPDYFTVHEDFDRWFMALLEEGDPERVARELTFEKLLTGGDGGAPELLAWLVAMGAAAELGQPKAESLFYVPSVPMRCGMGGSYWALGRASDAAAAP
jgi:aromatic ring-opening dioxygenase catalytic subunit (LigB family)